MLIKNSVVTSTVIWDQKQSEIYLVFKNTYKLPYQTETHQSISNTSTKHFYLVFLTISVIPLLLQITFSIGFVKNNMFCIFRVVLIHCSHCRQNLCQEKKLKILIFQGYFSVLLLMLAKNLVRNN